MSPFSGKNKVIKFSRCGKNFMIRKPFTSWQTFSFHEEIEDTIKHIMKKGWVKGNIKKEILNFIIAYHPRDEVRFLCVDILSKN